MSTLLLLSRDLSLCAHWRGFADGYQVVLGDSPQDLDELPPDGIAVCDLALPGLPPLDDPRWLAWTGDRKLLGADSVPSPERHVAVLNAGFRGYAHAYASHADWRHIVETAAAGGFWIGTDVMQRLLDALHEAQPTPNPDTAWQARLSERELEVAQLAVHGLPNKVIATQLGITERTVKAHLTAILAKLGVADRLQLALLVLGAR
ncbi:LuxR family transcriptional regulator [Chitiniphilus eburneus]|uniref:Response regulator transcription factor n=1 Tax=Chitiniphilus eburneus TaxID=2571148 RepID=A0A4U0Q124_9NEIS|nr:response regulator transcription factor [Chitiniphilus eburneus]TJZ74290.1 response regulator transcription factor [Chitiniphilus eburneus]